VLHKQCVYITCTSCKEHNPSGLKSVLADMLQVAFHQLLLNLWAVWLALSKQHLEHPSVALWVTSWQLKACLLPTTY